VDALDRRVDTTNGLVPVVAATIAAGRVRRT
jgi:hypothetical protein